MQIMESDTTTIGSKNRSRKKMIQIHHHRRQKQQPALQPILLIPEVGNNRNKTKM